MTWKYIKTGYESIYEYVKKNSTAACFYCSKPRDKEELEIELLDFKNEPERAFGICKICYPDFEIGNLATDRHVVEHILAKYKRRSDVLSWFKRNGYELSETDKSNDPEYDWKAYRFVNNPSRYKEFMERVRRSDPLPNGSYLTSEESQEMRELLNDETRIEIFKNGSIHIVY